MSDFDLVEALRRFPLPDGAEDAVLNRAQLAHALNTSDNTITKWIAAGMPVEQEGGNGKEYAFQLSLCYAWRLWRDESLASAKRTSDAAAAQIRLQFLNPGEEDDGRARLTPRQIKDEADAEFARLKAAQLRGELIPVARVSAALEDVFAAVRNGVTTLPDFAEMEFGLSPADVDKMQRRCDEILVDVRNRLEAEFGGPAEVTDLPRRAGA